MGLCESHMVDTLGSAPSGKVLITIQITAFHHDESHLTVEK